MVTGDGVGGSRRRPFGLRASEKVKVHEAYPDRLHENLINSEHKGPDKMDFELIRLAVCESIAEEYRALRC